MKVNEEEAETVRTLYDLYERLRTVRAVRDEAERLELRSRRRETSNGTVTGGNLFSRGHVYHILTNPLYAGRIRHRDEVHEGQHPALIDPDRWDRIQQKLQECAARQRGRVAAKRRSPLCGKLFDETGDRLTPSHAKTSNGTRHRYYISHRMAARSGEKHPGAWRLPAEELETRIAGLVGATLSRPGFVASLLASGAADVIAQASAAISNLTAEASVQDLLAFVELIDIAPGILTLGLSAGLIAEQLAIEPNVIDADRLASSHPFQRRKRGVETKIVLAGAPAGRDDTLIRNIARAHVWFESIKAGQTFEQIAGSAGTSKRRIQDMIGLAFLAPDIVRDVLDGKQPVGFTSDWSKSHELPSDWSDQRALLATL
ncbi:recombinase family protein [Ostreiculturibacter nitratireducens]|uniref:recombinase family protein n=1 Tax=Ostreiculturibacter nitratireducens TaxID=3075226 RepID=UPI0031B58B06